MAELTGKVGRHGGRAGGAPAGAGGREALAAEPGADAEAKADVGRSLTAVAGLLEATGKTDEAVATYREAGGAAGRPGGVADPAARAALAACRSRLGWLLSDARARPTEALAAYRLARADQEALAAAPGASNEARRDLADTINRIGILLSKTGKPAEAEAEYRKALAIQQKLADDNPAVTDFRSGLANSHHNLGILLSETGKPAEAEAEYRKALAIQQKLADDNPAVTDFRSRLAVSHDNLGILLSETGKPAEAEAEFRKALAIQQKLADDNPAVTDTRGIWRTACSTSVGSSLRPESTARRSVTTPGKRRSARSSPTASSATPEDRNSLANCQTNMADLLRKAGRRDEARAACERARALREPLVRDHPQDAELPRRARGDLPADRAGATRRGRPGRCGRRLEAGRRALRRAEVPERRADVFPGLLPRGPGGTRRPAGLRGVGRGGPGRVGPGHELVRRAVALGYRNPDAYRNETGPRPAPQPPRLPAPDDGPGLAGRPVRRGTLRPPGRRPAVLTPAALVASADRPRRLSSLRK